MTPKQFKAIRKGFGLTQSEWGRRLGYKGDRETIARQVRRFENGTRPIPPTIAVLVQFIAEKGLPGS